MKKLITPALLLTVLLALAACGSSPEPEETGTANMGNPWVDCADLEEAADLAGFEIAVPDRIEGYPNNFIQVMEGSMIQVFYCETDPGTGNCVLIRKGLGTDDISGDYGEYPETETASIHGVDVTLKGEDSLVYTETWTQDGYAYSVNADAGMSRDLAESLVELVK